MTDDALVGDHCHRTEQLATSLRAAVAVTVPVTMVDCPGGKRYRVASTVSKPGNLL
ncbi:hypothetical protein ACWT_0161 [Actinoplanes sp. SE50]|nr:hypothetical protein ACPL_276 [Actinoplanes sp. SE50/110]ATO79576.1 hypothetical protein ACWT_0161 [Actinoplanes sp. SE50]SLL96977.1 hypothetical protein ACSP50_0173 [Actinoplanes sp. SE50/110]